MAATSTGFVGALRFNFVADEAERRQRREFLQQLDSNFPQYQPVLLDSEVPQSWMYTPSISADPSPMWVRASSDPTDPRHTRPVARAKICVSASPMLPQPQWLLGWQPPRTSHRVGEETTTRLSHPSGRCEDWSTLRGLLPSRGYPVKRRPPTRWGSDVQKPPAMTDRPPRFLPHVNSEMTRHCDDMYVNDKEFWNR